MRKPNISTLLLALPLAIACAVLVTDAIAAGGVFANENANGSVELSNIPSSADQEPVVAAPPEPEAAVAAATAPGDLPAAVTKDPRESYRETMLQGSGSTAANPSISRRYKMMDRETYRATVLGIPPGTPADQPAVLTPSPR